MIIRDDPSEAREVLLAAIKPFGADPDAVWPPLLGPPDVIADGLQAFRGVGFDHVITAMQAPFDIETLERIGEVRRLVDANRPT